MLLCRAGEVHLSYHTSVNTMAPMSTQTCPSHKSLGRAAPKLKIIDTLWKGQVAHNPSSHRQHVSIRQSCQLHYLTLWCYHIDPISPTRSMCDVVTLGDQKTIKVLPPGTMASSRQNNLQPPAKAITHLEVMAATLHWTARPSHCNNQFQSGGNCQTIQ